MYKNMAILFIFLTSALFAAPKLEIFERFSKAEGGPDTRGAIWYDEKNHNIFVADHGKGLWKIDECGNNYGQTTNKDNGLWDISHDKKNIFAIGKKGLMIYDEDGNYLNSLNGIQGEGIYVNKGYAYIVNEKDGITIVNVKNIDNPSVVKTVMSGEKFSQIRGGKVTQKNFLGEESKIELLYVTSLDGKLYLFEINGVNITYKDDITIFPSSEARKIFVGKKELIYVNSNFGELAIVKVNKNNLDLKKIGSWQSSDNHGKGQQSPAAGGVFVKEIKDGDSKKIYALITAADGNSDGYLYWLDVTDPDNIKHVDTLHDTEEDYGFNDIWLNDTKIYLAAHDGFTFMSMSEARNTPFISVKDNDDKFKEDIVVTKYAENINDKKTFFVKVTNKESSSKLNAKLKAPASDSGWEYKYFDGDTDITNKITKNSGYILKNIGSNSSKDIKIEITPKADNAKDAVVKITATNKETKEICGKTIGSDDITVKVIFQGIENNTFTCSQNSYMFSSTKKDKPTDSYTVDIATGSSTLDKNHFHPTNINAIGYNVKDNYIWGYDRIEEKVTRVDANYNVTSFDIKNLPAKNFISGDVSIDGILYLYDKGDTIYRVDVNPSSENYLKKLDDLEISQQVQASDMAFNPIDNQIYLMDNDNGHLYRVNTVDGTVEDLGDTDMPKPKASGANYFDKYGNFYIYNNTGKIYKIDISDPSNIDPTLKYLSDAPEFESKDGARCPNAAIPEPPVQNECALSFPGALSSTNDEIQINKKTKIYGTTNHTLITKTLSAKKNVRCDDEPCKKSGTLATKIKVDLSTGDGHDGDKILTDNKSLTISSDKEYKKFQTGQHNTITINGDVTIKSQSDFYINQDTTININGHVVIYADKFDANQHGTFNINGSLKIITNVFYLNSGNKLQNIPNPQDFVVFANDIIDLNSQVDFKGLFYSNGDIQINNDTKITGALTGNYIDVNDKVTINYDADAVDAYCTTKPDQNQTDSNFNIWDIDESIDHPVIKTKIVGEDIMLRFATLNKDGSALETTNAKNIKIALFSGNNQLTIWYDIPLKTATTMDMTFTPGDFVLYDADNQPFRDVKVVIRYEDSDGKQHQSESTDHFAIRPKEFTLSVPSMKRAAETFTLQATALNLTDGIVREYNEQIKNTFDINYAEQNVACDMAKLDLSSSHFTSGRLEKELSYAEVGKLGFKIFEIPGHEYALIDKDDTPDNRRYIKEANSSTIEFRSAKLQVAEWILDGGDNHFRYFADMESIENMGSELDITVKAINLDGNITKNYRKECYLKDTNLSIVFDIEGSSGETNRLIWKDLQHPDHDSSSLSAIDIVTPSTNNSFSYDILPSSFINGVSNERLIINFGRDQSKTKEPIRFTVRNIKAINSDNINGSLTKNNQYVDFYYGRLHIPNYKNTNKESNITVFHEVYSKNADRTKFIYTNGKESVDNINWYILEKPIYNNKGFFTQVQSVNSNVFETHDYDEDSIHNTVSISLETNSIDNIKFKVSKLPYTDRIKYEPSPWLVYNGFNKIKKQHFFNIQLYSKAQIWAGKGKSGMNIDNDISTRVYKKMDW